MNLYSMPPAARALVEAEMQRHKHPNDLDVIEHPNYGPRVKLKCRVCPAETYVRIDTTETETVVAEETDEKEFVEYMRRLLELEKNGEKTTIKIGPWTAMMIIGLVQLATRHPATEHPLKTVALDFISQLQPLFTGTIGEEIIKRGNHPEFDK